MPSTAEDVIDSMKPIHLQLRNFFGSTVGILETDYLLERVVVVQLLSRVWLFGTPWTAGQQASLSFTIPWSLLKLRSIEMHAIQPSHPLLTPSPFALSLSQHQGPFQLVGTSHHVAKVLELQLQHQSFQWICRIDFL